MDEKDNPLVTICIPSFNRPRFIGDAIRSSRDQTYRNIEVIIVDDSSIAFVNSLYLIYAGITHLDPRFKVLEMKTNGGVSAVVNSALSITKGKYFTVLHDDDILPRNSIRDRVIAFETTLFADLGMVHADGDNVNLALQKLPSAKGNDIGTGLEAYNRIIEQDIIHGGTLMFSTNALKKIGGFDPNLRSNEDWDIKLRMIEQFNIQYINKVVTFYRQHPGQRNRLDLKRGEFEAVNALVAKKAQERKEKGLVRWLKAPY